MEQLDQCPICGGDKMVTYMNCVDHSISRETFTIVECSRCNFKFTNPRPSSTEIGRYYESNDYISHSNTKTGLINQLYQFVRRFTIQKKVNLINSLTSKSLTKEKNILDYGCGTGEFLRACKLNGWNTTGIEPSKQARDLAISENKLNVLGLEDLGKLISTNYHVITLWHVLEHVHDLKEFLKLLDKVITLDGVLIIAVPNINSMDAKHYKSFWAAYDVPRHLYHFTEQDIKQLFKQSSFQLTKKLGMPFDSFYVSMLSEKYINGKTNFFKAIWIGLLSNMSSFFNKNNYSSNIYILKKTVNN